MSLRPRICIHIYNETRSRLNSSYIRSAHSLIRARIPRYRAGAPRRRRRRHPVTVRAAPSNQRRQIYNILHASGIFAAEHRVPLSRRAALLCAAASHAELRSVVAFFLLEKRRRDEVTYVA